MTDSPPSHPALTAPFRVGHGFDLHRLEVGRPMIVGGVKLEHDRGPAGHSDGDVVYHAVTDALLGAIGAEDIGQLFPDDDPRWRDSDSTVFVAEAARRVADAGYLVGNLDVTVICQRPKISPHKAAMRDNLARLLGKPSADVNIKAKTHENVDAVGEGRAISCHVVALLNRRPDRAE